MWVYLLNYSHCSDSDVDYDADDDDDDDDDDNDNIPSSSSLPMSNYATVTQNHISLVFLHFPPRLHCLRTADNQGMSQEANPWGSALSKQR